MTFNNATYDTLKWIARYLLPGLGTLYFAVAEIWGLPYADKIVGTITAITAFINVLLGISTSNYEGDGTIELGDGLTEAKVTITNTAEELAARDTVTLMKVEDEDE